MNDNFIGWAGVSCVIAPFILGGAFELYQLGITHGKQSFDCPKAEAGEVAKIIYPDGTVKCPDYAKRIKRSK